MDKEKIKESNDSSKRKMIHESGWEQCRKEIIQTIGTTKRERCRAGKCVWGMSGVCIRPGCKEGKK